MKEGRLGFAPLGIRASVVFTTRDHFVVFVSAEKADL